MLELYEIIKETVFSNLKDQIKAGIFCDIEGDDLCVKIVNDDRTWECCISDIPKFMLLGCPIKKLTEKIVKEYKKEVMNRYFY